MELSKFSVAPETTGFKEYLIVEKYSQFSG